MFLFYHSEESVSYLYKVPVLTLQATDFYTVSKSSRSMMAIFCSTSETLHMPSSCYHCRKTSGPSSFIPYINYRKLQFLPYVKQMGHMTFFCNIFQPFTALEMMVLSEGERDSILYPCPNLFIVEYWSIVYLWWSKEEWYFPRCILYISFSMPFGQIEGKFLKAWGLGWSGRVDLSLAEPLATPACGLERHYSRYNISLIELWHNANKNVKLFRCDTTQPIWGERCLWHIPVGNTHFCLSSCWVFWGGCFISGIRGGSEQAYGTLSRAVPCQRTVQRTNDWTLRLSQVQLPLQERKKVCEECLCQCWWMWIKSKATTS